MSEVIALVAQESERAAAKFGPFTSSHEGLGVLTEEYHELLEAIRSNDLISIEHEAIQVSAVAMRIAECCAGSDFQARSGMLDLTPSRA